MDYQPGQAAGLPLRTRPRLQTHHCRNCPSSLALASDPDVLNKPEHRGLCTEHRGVNKGFDVGGKVLDFPRCPISDGGCASNGVPQDHREADPSVTSPADGRDAKVSDVYHDSALPPARGAGEGVSISPQCHISIAGCASNGVLQDQKEENPGGTSPEDQRDARMLDIYHDPALSLARVQRSKSRQRALAIRNSTQTSNEKRTVTTDYLSNEKRTVKTDSMCANLEREEHSPKALQEFQGRSQFLSRMLGSQLSVGVLLKKHI